MARIWLPIPMLPLDGVADEPYGTDADSMLPGLGAGNSASITLSLARSSLFPANITLRFGDARARASFRNGCRFLKDLCDVMS